MILHKARDFLPSFRDTFNIKSRTVVLVDYIAVLKIGVSFLELVKFVVGPLRDIMCMMKEIRFGPKGQVITQRTKLAHFSRQEVADILIKVAHKNTLDRFLMDRYSWSLHVRRYYTQEDFISFIYEQISLVLLSYDTYLARKGNKKAKARVKEMKLKGIEIQMRARTKFETVGHLYGYLFNALINNMAKIIQFQERTKKRREKRHELSLHQPVNQNSTETIESTCEDKTRKLLQDKLDDIGRFMNQEFYKLEEGGSLNWVHLLRQQGNSPKFEVIVNLYFVEGRHWYQIIPVMSQLWGFPVSDFNFKKIRPFFESCLLRYGEEHLMLEDYQVA